MELIALLIKMKEENKEIKYKGNTINRLSLKVSVVGGSSLINKYKLKHKIKAKWQKQEQRR